MDRASWLRLASDAIAQLDLGVLEETTAALISKCNFPDLGGPITLAVSGGPDSSALLALACACACEPHVIYVNHNQRPTSKSDAGVVAALCERFGARFEYKSVEVPPGPNLEARLREARNRVLPPGTATGHTQDDQVETMIINLMRGSGLDGLVAMNKYQSSQDETSRRIHPIIGLRRFETHKLCRDLKISPIMDSMNEDPRFVRNRVRHELIPLMNEISKRDVVEVMFRQSVLFSDDAAFLEELAGSIDPQDARELASAPAPLARRALRKWIASVSGSGYVEDFSSIERVRQVALLKSIGCNLKNGALVRRSGGKLRVEKKRTA